MALAVILECNKRSAAHGRTLVAMEGFCCQLSSEHHRDEFDPRQFCYGTRTNESSIAEHGDPVAHGIDLIEEVRDEDNTNPARFQIIQNTKESLDLLRIE